MDNGSQPATKADLDAAKTELRDQLRDEMKAMEERLVEAFRDGQTELLKAFYTAA